METEVKLTIDPKRIADMMCCAIEGNHMTRAWCEGVYLKKPARPPKHDSGPWYTNPSLYEGDFEIEIIELADLKGKTVKHLVGPKDFADAFTRMSRKCPEHFGDFLADNEDAITADVWLQLVALNEVIYG